MSRIQAAFPDVAQRDSRSPQLEKWQSAGRLKVSYSFQPNTPMHKSQYPLSLLTASAVLWLSGSAIAQAPANDECANATPLTLGTTVTGDNTGGSLGASDPAWSCGANITSDVWFSVTAAATCALNVSTCGSGGTLNDTVLEVFEGGCGALSLIVCNDDGCGTGFLSNATWTATAGSTYHIRVGGWGTGQGDFDITCSGGALQIAGSVDMDPLAATGGTFTNGSVLNYELIDCSTGNLATTIWNLQAGGPPAVGTTPEIPGFIQLSHLSTPAGVAIIGDPISLPHGVQTFTVPAGLFFTGDTIRMQGLMLDPANATGTLPAVPSENTLLFTYSPGSCIAGTEESFEGVPTGVGNYPTGWSDGGGTQQWQVNSSGTPSGGTGPQNAFSGTNYFYCETSSPAATGDTYNLNSPTYSTVSGPQGVQFALSRVGATVGTLEVRMADMNAAVPSYDVVLQVYSGASNSEWDTVLVNFPASTPSNISIQWNYIRGTSFTGDVAIDAVCILQ